jgi:hypothetical protein
MNGLDIHGSRIGQRFGKTFRSQNADHGATIRMSPASMKYAAKSVRVKNEISASGLGP